MALSLLPVLSVSVTEGYLHQCSEQNWQMFLFAFLYYLLRSRQLAHELIGIALPLFFQQYGVIQ